MMPLFKKKKPFPKHHHLKKREKSYCPSSNCNKVPAPRRTRHKCAAKLENRFLRSISWLKAVLNLVAAVASKGGRVYMAVLSPRSLFAVEGKWWGQSGAQRKLVCYYQVWWMMMMTTMGDKLPTNHPTSCPQSAAPPVITCQMLLLLSL